MTVQVENKTRLKHALTATAMAYIMANNVWRSYLGMKPRPVKTRKRT